MSDFYLIKCDLQKAIEGDLSAFDKLNKPTNHKLIASKETSHKLTLKTKAVTLILRELLEDRVNPILVQEWASFIKRGYFPNANTSPIRAIDIEYDPVCEDKIAEVIARLDEIGDLIDGTIAKDEIALMLASMS